MDLSRPAQGLPGAGPHCRAPRAGRWDRTTQLFAARDGARTDPVQPQTADWAWRSVGRQGLRVRPAVRRRLPMTLRLGVNIDHVATIRNARGGAHPDPVRAAHLAVLAGADGITAHLREDRRHIRDDDMERLKRQLFSPLNFEMAATDEMIAIARRIRPHGACLVPEKR